ncbi:M23 family metallopeptidase [Altererythrobacter aquiaggeris]|uniref:M23 family metallopeptidase n=1 Tax=Aestuarierythrobacter aquiaggeris TaxID=1898396 RepID=UPI00301AB1B2
MFTSPDDEPDDVKGGGSTMLALSGTHVLDYGKPQVMQRVRSLSDRFTEWRANTSEKFETIDLAPDLAEEIGSRRWLRGAGTLLGLSAIALAFWPDFSPVEAAPAMRIDESARDEFRSQMILPLALGGDTGRRMAATPAVVKLKTAPERPSIDMVATLAKGDSFSRTLRRAGVGRDEAELIANMIAAAVPLSDIEAGTRMDITLGRRPAADDPRPLDAMRFRARFDLELALERTSGGLSLKRNAIKVDSTPLRIRGIVGNSLYRSARAAGAPSGAVQQYLQALDGQLNLERDIVATDQFDLIVEYKRAATGETQTGKVLYAGIERGGSPRAQLMRWGSSGRFFEASGVGEQRSGLVQPVAGRISSGFGMRRHPVLGYRRMHSGIDFKAQRGTPIVAVTDGVVTGSGRMGGCGNAVKLQHGGGLATRYCHMSRIAADRGARVRRGQVIGYVGSTGLSTGPHLHYELYRGNRKVDPRSVSFVTRAQLEGAELQQFRDRLAELRQVKAGEALQRLTPETSAPEAPVREIDRIAAPKKVG